MLQGARAFEVAAIATSACMQVGATLATVEEGTFVVDATESIFVCGATAVRLVRAIFCSLIDWIVRHNVQRIPGQR